MINAFESMVHAYPQRTCFTYVDELGGEAAYSYRETRLLSAALAYRLRDRGVQQGDCISVDLPNCPEYVFLMLAAAYGGFSLVILNNRLSASEKLSRITEVGHRPEISVQMSVDEGNIAHLINRATAFLSGENASYGTSHVARSHRPSFTARTSATSTEARTTRALGRASSGKESIKRRDEVARQSAVESVIHYAEHAAHLFDRDTRAAIMFTSGTTGRAKIVPLTWNNICRSSEASNATLNRRREGLWQAVLPLYHIGGFQVVMRSLLNCSPFILYRHFDADRILEDAAHKGATHVSVVDKILQDLLASSAADALQRYSCILLGGGVINPKTLDNVRQVGARVFASYGMTETSSQIANARVTDTFQGGLRLLPDYEAHVVSPGEDGFGRLAVKGPGLFNGYLNARAAYTVDGYFLTGDTAALRQGLLYVKERTEDMFVSGGENIYPAEIREKLLCVPGVKDAHVFGAPDPVWGRRPVALVERECVTATTAASPAVSASLPAVHRSCRSVEGSPSAPRPTNQQFASSVRSSLIPRISKLYVPKHICALDEFPRSSIGKIDRGTLERYYEERIEVARVIIYRVKQPFVHPFKTAKATMRERESLIVEVVDHAGRTGLGECLAFSTDWYLPETIDQDVRVLRDVLAPLVLHEVLLHPREASKLFASHPDVAAFPLACGALEPALWDLYGKIVGKPLWKLIGGTQGAKDHRSSASVPVGAVIGIGSVSETIASARRCVDAGYRRIKLKVAPRVSLACVRAVRAAYPDLMITLDANQSFTERNIDELRGLDACDIAWIEEPLDPHRMPAVGPTDLFARLVRLQSALHTPLCLDESIAHPHDLALALTHPELRCYAVKIGKFGGVQPTLDFLNMAQARGITVWMGGMYDTGISKRLHAAFETLDAVKAPGDIGATFRYFARDVTDPPHTVERGRVTLNCDGYEYGLGCDLNRSSLANMLIDRIVIE